MKQKNDYYHNVKNKEEILMNIKGEYNHIIYESYSLNLFIKRKIKNFIFIAILIIIFEIKDNTRIIALLKSRKYFHNCSKDLLIKNF